MLTTDQKQAYVAAGGLHCPNCNSDNIAAIGVEIHEAGADRHIYCNSCGRNWIDRYKLVSILEIDG